MAGLKAAASRRKLYRGAFASLTVVPIACLLVACAAPPAVPDEAYALTAPALPTNYSIPDLMPLWPALTVPAGAPAASAVAAVNYDLSVVGTGSIDLPPDDPASDEAGLRNVFERGGASWYGLQFHQRKTANGERFDMMAMTAAHKTLPFGTRVCVKSLVNGREVMVRINDRGPYVAGRIIDLSRGAADVVGMLGAGIKQVSLSYADNTGRCGDQTQAVDHTPPVDAPVKPIIRQRAPVKRARR